MSSLAAAPDLVEILQAIVREELRRLRVAELGVVTAVFPHESSGDQNNYQCTVKLRDTGLELPRVPVAVQRIGLAAIPNVNDLVLVQFIGGSLQWPVITACLYNDQDRPPEAKAREWVYITRDGPESGVRRLYLEFPNGNKLTLDDDKAQLELGDTRLTINNGGDVQIDSNAKVVINSQDKIEIAGQGDIEISAQGAISLKAQSDLKLEGLSATVKAQTSAQLEGGAGATVKGPMLSLAGNISFSPG